MALAEFDGAAPAHGQDQLDLVGAAQVDAFIYKAQGRVGLDPAQLDPFNPGVLQGLDHPVVQAGFFDGAAAVMQQDLFVAL